MNNLIKKTIQEELERNVTFQDIFKKFKIPEISLLDGKLDLIYKSNEYMGYYKKELYFDLLPKEQMSKCRGTLRVTFVSNVEEFDIKKAMHLLDTDEVHNVSLTFVLYNDKDGWDTERYNYTLWKNDEILHNRVLY